jgi:hypothetical protein
MMEMIYEKYSTLLTEFIGTTIFTYCVPVLLISRKSSPSLTMSPLKYFNYDSKCQKHFYVTASKGYY